MTNQSLRPRLTVLSPCFNERENVRALHERVKAAVVASAGMEWVHLFIDNASTDGTGEKLRGLAAHYPHLKVICNQRNFGHVRSPFYGLLQAEGDAVIVLPADMQVPPELIGEFIRKWREGAMVIFAQRTNSAETPVFRILRRFYYDALRRLADVELHENTPGYGLYDRQVIESFRALDDPYPYVRGLVSELGFPVALVPYAEERRMRGLSKNNFYTLYDVAMLGLTNHTKIPLRLATMLGFVASAISFLVGVIYLVYKLIFWDRFALGVAPVVIGVFFFASVQLFFIGIIGEYIGAIHTRVSKRPLVIEKERIGFDSPRR